ncbi:MAG: autotransporter outer membrane beta-barrel domain-containing protein [Thermoguttaceae bacterium]
MTSRQIAISVLCIAIVVIATNDPRASASDLRLPMGDAVTRLDTQFDGGFTNIGKDGNASGINVSGVGFRVGVDRKVSPCWVVGLGVGYYGGAADGNDAGAAQTNFSSLLVTTQTELRWRRLVFRLDGGYVGQKERVRAFDVTANNTSDQGNLGIGIGIPNDFGFSTVEPILAFRQVFVTDSPTGGVVTPDTARRKGDATTLIIGGRYSLRYATPLTTVLPCVEAYWLHDLAHNSIVTISDRDTIIPAHIYRNANTPNDRLALGVGVASRMGRSLDLAIRYSVQMGGNFSHHGIIASMNWNF